MGSHRQPPPQPPPVTVEETLPLLRRLIKIPSVSGGEHEIARYLLNRLAKKGFEVELIPVSGCGPTLLATHPYQKKGRSLLLYGHIDTVEPAGRWRHNPFKPTLEGRRLYGLGASDMKGGLTALILAGERLAGMDLKGRLVLALASDEELHSRGCDTLIQTRRLEGIDAAISGEATGGASIEVGRRGRMVYDITVLGRSAHGATPQAGVNAVLEASRLVTKLSDLPVEGEGRAIPGSVSVLHVSGGTDFLSTPDHCQVLIDRHLAPGESRGRALKQMRALIEALGSEARFRVGVKERLTPPMDPYLLNPDEPIIGVVEKAFKGVRGFKPERTVGLSVADENYLVNRGRIPTVTLGPRGGNEHGADEYVEVESVVETANIYIKAGAFF